MAKQKDAKTKAGSSGPKKYKHPIPERSELIDFLTAEGKPLKIDVLLKAFSLRGQRMRILFEERLQKMVRAGQIIENRRNEFCLVEKLELVAGVVSSHKDGFGFVLRDDGGDDIYLSAREMRSLLHGDRVAVKIVGLDNRGRPEGKLVEVLERGMDEIAGQFIRERGIGLVMPDNPRIGHRILVPPGEAASAKPGQIVVVRILDYPTAMAQATGRVIKIIGKPGDKGIATDIAIQSHGIPNTWPKEVRSAAMKFGKEVPETAKPGRTDLRDVALLTIDGADARDFDDAVYCQPAKDGWTLLVAIADVAHYVEIGGAIDHEAIKRATSVYFPDRVVPMLPEVLSNGLCSLNPKVDRLCMVCEMHIDRKGNVTQSRFFEGLMRSAARLTYTQVAEFLEGNEASKVSKDLHVAIRHLHDLYKALAIARSKRGAVNLDIPQLRIQLNDDGVVDRIVSVERNDAHKLIEECMIAANVEAAKFLHKNKIQGLYRVHDKPDEERFDDLRLFLTGLGLKVPHVRHVEPKHLNMLIEQVADRPDSHAISMTMLRSLQHAEYTPANIGHFGLALQAYAHFTSPIRRYPDLLVHRAIKHIVGGGKAGSYNYDLSAMERLGHTCSAYERRAEEATREVEAWLKCQFMEDKVGQEFVGIVTGVTHFGLFVMLDEFQIDGLVHVTSLQNDYYHFDAGGQRLVGERSGTTFRVGDEMHILVSKVDMENKRIDFQPAGKGAREERKSGKRPARSRSRSRK